MTRNELIELLSNINGDLTDLTEAFKNLYHGIIYASHYEEKDIKKMFEKVTGLKEIIEKELEEVKEIWAQK